MLFGNGIPSNFPSIATHNIIKRALDIAAHELTHAVTKPSNLCRNESGALMKRSPT